MFKRITKNDKLVKREQTSITYQLYTQPFAPFLSKKKGVRRGTGYKDQKAFMLLRVADGEVRDIFPVKTRDTFEVILQSQDDLMCQANPVKIPEGYWIEYRQARTPQERIALAKKYHLLKDQQILAITYIVLDIDSSYEEVKPVWDELVKKLGLQGYKVYKTKSGRFRAYIPVRGNYYEKRTQQGKEEKNKVGKIFYHTPHGRGRNHKTHLENAYEIQYILGAFFEKRGLKVDPTFIGRLNHPIWLEGRPVGGQGHSTLMEFKGGNIIRLYTLYNRVKKLQREEGLWTFNGKNLTQELWGKEPPKKERPKTRLIREGRKGSTLTDEEKFEIAVRTLASKYRTHRFTKVMLPACGWAKDLGLTEAEVYNILQDLLWDKKNFDKDFEKAWRYSRPLRFEWKDRPIQAEQEGFSEKMVKFLKACLTPTERKHIRKLFKTEADYYEVERHLLKHGYIEASTVKKEGRGRGRPPKV
ncbi:MAG: hypothetical protein ACP5P0_00545, partial [Hydrogenobacter sp.]